VSKTAHPPPVYFLRNSLSAPRQGRKSRWRTKRRGALAVTPEIRYTRWNGGSWSQSLVDSVVGSQNQVQFLVGVTF